MLARSYGYSTIGDLIWDWRINQDMMAKEVADVLGVSVVTVGRWSPDEVKRHVTEKAREKYRESLVIAREVCDRSDWQGKINADFENGRIARGE